jgi:type II secretory pathway component PulJ
MKRKPGNFRVGFSLIEVLLAVTSGSVVMVLAVSLVHRGMAYQADTQTRVEQSTSFNRFVEQFRSDVHRATRVEATDGGLILFTEPSARVTYSTDGSRLNCERLVATTKQFEQVDLAHNQTAILAYAETMQLCSLEIRVTTQNATPRIWRRIVAAVGLNCPNWQSTTPEPGETP